MRAAPVILMQSSYFLPHNSKTAHTFKDDGTMPPEDDDLARRLALEAAAHTRRAGETGRTRVRPGGAPGAAYDRWTLNFPLEDLTLVPPGSGSASVYSAPLALDPPLGLGGYRLAWAMLPGIAIDDATLGGAFEVSLVLTLSDASELESHAALLEAGTGLGGNGAVGGAPGLLDVVGVGGLKATRRGCGWELRARGRRRPRRRLARWRFTGSAGTRGGTGFGPELAAVKNRDCGPCSRSKSV